MAVVLNNLVWDLSTRGVVAHPLDLPSGEGGAWQDPYDVVVPVLTGQAWPRGTGRQ